MKDEEKKVSVGEEKEPFETKFMQCVKCGTIHIVVDNINDRQPTCKKCNGTKFKPTNHGIPGYMPEYCDQRKNKRIWDGVMAVVLWPIYTWKAEMEKKYNIEFSKSDIQDLAKSIAVVGKSMVNVSRDNFSKDNFVNALKGQFRSFLFSQQRKKRKTIKKHD